MILSIQVKNGDVLATNGFYFLIGDTVPIEKDTDEIVTVPISVVNNPGFNAVSLRITFDTNELQPYYVDASWFRAMRNDLPLNQTTGDTGSTGSQVLSLVNGTKDLEEDVVILELTFKVIKTKGNINITLEFFRNIPPSNVLGKDLDDAKILSNCVITIKNPKTYDEAVAQAKEALTWDEIKNANTAHNAVTTNLNLITSGAAETTIFWASDKSAIISTSGAVTRPTFSDGDETVKLTAIIRKGTASESLDFILIVLKSPDTDTEPNDTGSSNLQKPDSTNVIETSSEQGIEIEKSIVQEDSPDPFAHLTRGMVILLAILIVLLSQMIILLRLKRRSFSIRLFWTKTRNRRKDK